MTPQQRNNLRVAAGVEGAAVVARNIGEMHTVSSMELVTLCNFAELGLMQVFAEACASDELRTRAAADLERHIDLMRRTFAAPKGSGNGLTRLAQTCAGLLRSERFRDFLVCEEVASGGA